MYNLKIRTALLGVIIMVIFRLDESSPCDCITAVFAECFSYSNQNSPAVPSSAAVTPKNKDIETKLVDWHHEVGNSRLYIFIVLILFLTHTSFSTSGFVFFFSYLHCNECFHLDRDRGWYDTASLSFRSVIYNMKAVAVGYTLSAICLYHVPECRNSHLLGKSISPTEHYFFIFPVIFAPQIYLHLHCSFDVWMCSYKASFS